MTRPASAFDQDLAIYSPFAASYYDRDAPQGGGAEIQMTLLARELASRGQRVAHIVFPVTDPVETGEPTLTVQQREAYNGNEGGFNRVREARAVWGALGAVNARTYLIRASSIVVPMVAEFCRLHRRGMLFSAANDFDLTEEPVYSSAAKHRLYLHGLRRAGVVIVQTDHQIELARKVARPGQPVRMIPSFAQPAEAEVSNPDTFLWVSRITGHKQPLEFIRLARSLPDAAFTMVAAEGIDTDRELLAQIRKEADQSPNLEVVGPLRREEVLRLLERSVAIVSTSVWEGMPNVFLEAWGRSVPALTLSFDPDGLIAQRGLGIAAAGSFERFEAGARELWSNRARMSELGRNGADYIEERHSPTAVGDQWVDALRSVER